uniref:WS_DGAT_C domain-containing protein n=1 Tax=Meloidogyne hapla TaxID=6305 RepID=A0A1I8B6P2_MELHA
MAFNLIGHSMNSIARMTVPRLDLDITQSTIVTHSLSCLTNFVMASNGPILYLSNQEYRQAFHKVFKIKNTTKVVTVGTANNVNKHISKNNLNQNKGPIPIN